MEEYEDHIAHTPHPGVSDAELKTLNVTQQMLDRIKEEILEEFMNETRGGNGSNNSNVHVQSKVNGSNTKQNSHAFNTSKLHSKKYNHG